MEENQETKAEEKKPEHALEQKHETPKEHKHWYDKHYKTLLLIPIAVLVLSLVYLFIFYQNHGDFIYKDVSLSGGTSITLQGDINREVLETGLKTKFPDVSFTSLGDVTSQKQIALIIESSTESQELKLEIEKILGYELTDANSTIEFTGSTLSQNFYKQLIMALIISFILMSFVILFLFRTLIPSIAVIFAVFADIVMPLAVLNFFEVKISAAGIAAFLMLIGYSVDTDILLTSRALKSHEDSLNKRIHGAFKTGILMTLTALAAVLPAFFLVTGLPDSFRQIFLILAIGLCADIFNTWLTNASIIKWYCDKKGIK
jgi:preprotein translocase subunit SecF